MVIFRRYERALLHDLDFADNVHVVLIILYRTADSGKKQQEWRKKPDEES